MNKEFEAYKKDGRCFRYSVLSLKNLALLWADRNEKMSLILLLTPVRAKHSGD